MVLWICLLQVGCSQQRLLVFFLKVCWCNADVNLFQVGSEGEMVLPFWVTQ